MYFLVGGGFNIGRKDQPMRKMMEVNFLIRQFQLLAKCLVLFSKFALVGSNNDKCRIQWDKM